MDFKYHEDRLVLAGLLSYEDKEDGAVLNFCFGYNGGFMLILIFVYIVAGYFVAKV